MATPTVTSTLTASTHTITVTGTGGVGNTSSIAQIMTVANNARAGSISYDSSTKTYTLNRLTATTQVVFNINNNCTVQIPQDTSVVIQTNLVVSSATTISTLAVNAKLICRQGSRIQWSTSSGGYVIINGCVNAIGTQQKPVIWQKYYRLYNYTSNANGEPSYYQYMIFRNISTSTGFYMYFSITSQIRQCDIYINNCTFTNDNQNKYGTVFYFGSAGLYTNIHIQNIIADYISQLLNLAGGSVKLKNIAVSNCAGTMISTINASGTTNNNFITSKESLWNTGTFQSYLVLQNIYFDNGANTSIYAITANSGIVYVKNCTFNTTNDVVYRAIASTNGSLIIQNGNNITALLSNAFRKIWTNQGTILHGHQLDLTVLDTNNAPIQNAIVSIIQKDGRQKWSGITNAQGKLCNVHGDAPVFIQKQQTALNAFQDWSDPGHTITISYPGYKLYSEDMAFTEDKTVVVNLKKLPEIKEDSMEYNIVQEIKTAIQTIPDIKYIGYYPYDFGKVTMNMPAVLIKYSDSIIQALGHHNYEVNASTDIILYRDNNDIASALQIESGIIDTIVQTLHNSQYCVTGVGQFQIYTGDINQYILPSQTGYNGQMIVRKMTVNYQFTKII